MNKLNHKELIKISNERKLDCYALLKSGRWHASVYMGGYALEVALKACIIKDMNKQFYFNKKDWDSVYTHKINELVVAANLKNELAAITQSDKVFSRNWDTVTNLWQETLRYRTHISKNEASDFYKALTQRKHGVLRWTKSKW